MTMASGLDPRASHEDVRFTTKKLSYLDGRMPVQRARICFPVFLEWIYITTSSTLTNILVGLPTTRWYIFSDSVETSPHELSP